MPVTLCVTFTIVFVLKCVCCIPNVIATWPLNSAIEYIIVKVVQYHAAFQEWRD